MKRLSTIARHGMGIALVVCFVFAFASTAAAASTYTLATPAPGATVPTAKPLISVRVADPAGIWISGAQIKIDGVLRTPKLTWGPGNAYVTLSYQQTTALKNGAHTVYASVFTGAGRTSYTWTFGVNTAPTLGPLTPADGSTTNSQTPAISVGVIPNGSAVASYVMTVDGAQVTPVYDAVARTMSYVPVTPLANDAEHAVTLSVTDTAGNSSNVAWRFGVQIYANMADTAGCTDCHLGFPVSHPMSDCDGCHEPTGPYPAYWNTDPEYASAHSSSYIEGDNCTYCHSTVYPNVPGHYASTQSIHFNSADMSGCACHVRDLTIEHNRYTTASGEPITCLTCHLSDDPIVQTAMREGKRACADCHVSAAAGSHDSLHTVERTDSCASCHAGESLTAVHLGSGLSCNTCHASSDPEVLAAIAGDLRECSACHTAQGVDYHLNMAVHYAPDSYETCGSCHHAWGSSPIQGPDVTRHPGGCTTCHNDQMDLTGLTTKCANCHIENGVDFHPALAEDHTPLDDGSQSCARCHETTDVRTVHTTYSCETCHSGGCSDCHSMHAPAGGALERATSCDQCHETVGTDYHLGFSADHTFSAMDAGCQSAGCHSSSLVEAHSAFVGEGGRYPQYSDTCALCHLNDDPVRVPAQATADCASCHEVHGDLAAVHTATVTDTAFTILGTSFGTHECDECHASADLRDLHADCGTCHPAPADSATPYAGGCVQGGCHAAGSSAPQHLSVDTAHVVALQSCTVGCHAGGTNIAAVHAGPGCAACHAPGVTPSTDCATCHDLGSPHGDDRAIHQPAALSGAVTMFDNHDGMGQLDYGVDCTWCHGTTNLIDVHGGDCMACHDGPRSTFTTWNETCQQGGCHVTYHTEASAGHQAEYYSTDCEDWCHNNDWTVPPENCGGCHTLTDSAPPATTSNAVASYVGTARVTLWSSDPFPSGGVAHTYYKIDGGIQTEGTLVTVPGPASGSAAHTIEFWSVDAAGNTETPHKFAGFTLNADTVAPVTTSNAKASYTGPAVIQFSATDNGSAGVKATYYTVDGGAAQTGSVTTVPQPSSGTQAHTVQFWSVDWSDNIEGAHTVEFTNAVDSAAPTTTQSGITTWVRTTWPTVTLTAADTGDAGVAASYARVDGGTLYGGASTGSLRVYPYALQGMHTLTYWSVDAVGNTEAANSFAYGVDNTSPVTSVITQNNYYGTANIAVSATDNLSGVKNTYYRLNSGATQTGNAIAIAPPASGSVYYVLQVWSEDNAGNTGSSVYRYFYVYPAAGDTTPPTGTMSVDNGATYTTTTAATVNSAMTDAGGGMSQMRIDPGTGTYGSWIAYSATSAITLPTGDGVKTVRAEYRDVAGNVAARSDTITLDTTGPAGTMSIDGGALTTTERAVSIDSAVSDATSGMQRMRIDPGTGTYGAWISYAGSAPVALPSGDGTKTVNAQYQDNAGNSSTLTDTIWLSEGADTTPPTTTSNAQLVYTGTATISLSADDGLGGSGVANTYYTVDGGAQTQGTSIAVPAPVSGSVVHTIEFWSVDNAGNTETRSSASFTVNAPAATGTIELAWWAADGSWADYWVYDYAGNLVASGSDDTSSGWDGWFRIAVPVSPNPYSFYTDWYDSDWGDEGSTSGQALIDSAGKVVTIWY